MRASVNQALSIQKDQVNAANYTWSKVFSYHSEGLGASKQET